RSREGIVVHVGGRHEDTGAGRDVVEGRLQAGSVVSKTSNLGRVDREHKVGFRVVDRARNVLTRVVDLTGIQVVAARVNTSLERRTEGLREGDRADGGLRLATALVQRGG